MSNVITVSVIADVARMRQGLNQVNSQLTSFQTGVKKAGSFAKGIVGGAVAYASVQKLTGALKDSVSEARESQKVNALTANVIKTTGGAANVSAGQVAKLSTAISNKTGIDDEAVQTGANLLLTFKNVRNEVGKGNQIFNSATQAAVDLSASGFGSVDSASKQLGKALNDPIKGMTALSKSGVTFTAQQQEQIKSMVKNNDLLGAQKIILGEVNSQVGGSAAAQATAGEKLKVVIDNIKESIGTALLPLLDQVQTYLVANLPGWIATASAAFATFKAGFITVLPAIKIFLSFLKNFGPALLAGVVAYKTITGAMAAYKTITTAVKTAQIALNLAMVANPIGLVIVAIAALVAIFVLAYQHSETFRNIVNKVFSFIKTFVPAAISFVVNFVRDHWKLLIAILAGPIGIAVLLITKHWNSITAGVAKMIAAVKQKFNDVVNFIKGIPGKIKAGIGNVGGLLVDAGKAVIQGLIDGIGKMAGKVKSALGAITKLIPLHKGPISKDKVLLRPAGLAIMDGLISGITDKERELKRTLGAVTKTVAGTSFASPGVSVGMDASAFMGAGSSGTTIIKNEITIVAPVGSSKEDIGRELQKHLDAFSRAGGRGKK